MKSNKFSVNNVFFVFPFIAFKLTKMFFEIKNMLFE